MALLLLKDSSMYHHSMTSLESPVLISLILGIFPNLHFILDLMNAHPYY